MESLGIPPVPRSFDEMMSFRRIQHPDGVEYVKQATPLLLPNFSLDEIIMIERHKMLKMASKDPLKKLSIHPDEKSTVVMALGADSKWYFKLLWSFVSLLPLANLIKKESLEQNYTVKE